MGVDITTYRCRIGRFGGICGNAILTGNADVNFNTGLQAVGSVLFIGILLLIAGVESNPGPIPGRPESSPVQEDMMDKGYEDTSRQIRDIFAKAITENQRIIDENQRVLQGILNICSAIDLLVFGKGTSDSYSQRVSPSTIARQREVKEVTTGHKQYFARINKGSNQKDADVAHIQTVGDHLQYQEKYRDMSTSTEEDTITRLGEINTEAGSSLKVNVCTQTPIDNLHRDVSEKRKCVHYSVSTKCWPRVYKSQQVIRDLVDRCSYIEGLFGLPSSQHNEQVNLLKIDIYKDSTIELDFESLLVRCDRFERKGTAYINVSQKNISDESFSLRENFAGIFIDGEGVKLVKAISPEQINVVENGSFVEKKHQFDSEQAKIELSSILEQVIFEILTVKFNILKELYENRMRREFDKHSSRLCMSAEDKTDVGIETSFSDLVIQYKDTVEQLLGEMVAFFKRSTLPENKRPVLRGFEKKEVSKEIKEKLFGLDKTIRGCGYSYCTFNVNVERLSDEEETVARRKRIIHFLEENGITNIKFNIVSDTVTEYKRVGARLSVPELIESGRYHKGTLGGFASFSKENITSSCALFSRHVALGCNAKLYVDGDNGQLTELGEILEDTLKHGSYDIAAAKIHEKYIEECDFQFKNSENVPLPGKLYKSATDIELQHLPVHLWGSVSKPGLGIITIPNLNCPEATETYIQIEDRDSSGKQEFERMAVAGDSGAIVCADDLDDENVHVISMLIGSNNDEMRRKNPNEKSTYITFPVNKGVENLQSKTNGIFTLKGVHND